MSERLFINALNAAKACFDATPTLRDFVPWPAEMEFRDRVAHAIPGIEELRAYPGAANELTLPLRDALIALSNHIEWRLTYSEDEVGRDFLNRFGWFELAGPCEGYFQTDITRMTVGYWGPNLYYPWHLHAAEELYFVVSGSGEFAVEGQEPKTLIAGDTMFHASNQPHALTTRDSGVLAFVLWRGDGLADPPKMEGEA